MTQYDRDKQYNNKKKNTPALYRDLFYNDVPLLDVRAPIEFARGAFPQTANIALLDDEQRRLVGTTFKQYGQARAIALGHELVNGDTKMGRMQQWIDWVRNNPDGYLYCFRGGLRSETVQHWLDQAGLACPKVPGGYKAMRRFLIETLEDVGANYDLVLIAGATGSGKTELIQQLDNAPDLEGRANHRGSAFGTQTQPQPTQINFENSLAIDFLKLSNESRTLYLEDEGRAIGSISTPVCLYQAMSQAPIVHIKESIERRTRRILNDYIIDNLSHFERASPDTALSRFSDYLLSALSKVQRRLGGDRYQKTLKMMQAALQEQRLTHSTERHNDWIIELLQDYYDPMYRYQLEKRASRIIFTGNTEQFWDWHYSKNPTRRLP